MCLYTCMCTCVSLGTTSSFINGPCVWCLKRLRTVRVQTKTVEGKSTVENEKDDTNMTLTYIKVPLTIH